MTTRDSLLLACLLQPEDRDAPQVLADYLDEFGGEADRTFAEYLRCWCEWKAIPDPLQCPGCGDVLTIQPMSSMPPLSRCRKCHLTHGPFWADIGRKQRERDDLRARCDSFRAEHEASWRRVPCAKCSPEGKRWVTCAECHGTGFTGPLSERVEKGDGVSDYTVSDWRHRVSWQPFPVVTATLDEIGREIDADCPSCFGARRVSASEGDRQVCCPTCHGKGSGRVWVPSPFAVGVVRMGGTFAVSDKIPNDYGPPEDGCRYGWLSEHEHGVGFAGLPRCVLRSIPPTGQRYAGRYSTSDAASLALSRALTVLTLSVAFPGWSPQTASATQPGR